MEVKELRVGNIVKCQDALLMVDIKNISMHKSFEPIELTPDILVKCGFIDISGDRIYAKYYMYVNDSALQFAWHIKSNQIEWASIDDITLSHVKCLHQLQNLYYVLTGEELEVKL